MISCFIQNDVVSPSGERSFPPRYRSACWRDTKRIIMAAGFVLSEESRGNGGQDISSDLHCSETLEYLEASPTNNNNICKTSYDLPDLALMADDGSCAPPVRALRDLVLRRDDRVLQNLLRAESRSLPTAPDYFRFVQRPQCVAPPMRKIVADWMLQVCQELQCQPEVFVLAMNYFDRFLARCRVTKGSLQLIGSVCLLLASKFKETCPILGEKLIFYSDFSIKSDEIKDWELLILQELRWELSTVTPLDFLDPLLDRLSASGDKRMLGPTDEYDSDVRRRAETMLVLAATEYKYCYLNPSLLASSAIYAVLSSGLSRESTGWWGKSPVDQLLRELQTLTHTKKDDIVLCAKQLTTSSPSYLTSTSTAQQPISEPEVTSSVPPFHCVSSSTDALGPFSTPASPSSSTPSSTTSSVTIPEDFQRLHPTQQQQVDRGTYSVLVS